MALTLFAFVITLSLLVFVHELGHFLVAKRSGIAVEEFGFGYPPRVWTFARRGGTEYTLNAIPFGGFVRLAGENDPTVAGGFASAPKRFRLATLLAGSGMNLALALVCFTLAAWFTSPVGQGVMLESVVEGSPAASAGLQAGDVVLTADGLPMRTSRELHDYIYSHLGREITFRVRKGAATGPAQEVLVRIVPRTNPPQGEGAIGVVLRPKYSWLQALRYGAQMTLSVVVLTLQLPILLLRGTLTLEEARPVGPVGIAQLAGGAMAHGLATGLWYPLFLTMGFVSAALGVTNLLPLPALDGGRIAFLLVEAVRGKRVDPEKEALVHMMGMALLIGLMVLVTYQDLVSPLPLPDWGKVF
ncbi:MAG: M50 family metallopeptidase [Anaerolineae bacterium]